MSAVLLARGLRYAWRGRPVLNGVDLRVDTGEVVSLLGANGAGKSTLLRLLLGLLRPAAGDVLLDGTPIASMPRRLLARRLAYVPQVHVSPFPYPVRDVVLLGRLPHAGLGGLSGRIGPADRQAADAALARLSIAHLAERPYTEISGGERQLVLIARALAQGARLLVMDEPTGGLDYGNQLRLLELLRTLAADGFGVLKTTHHPDHVLHGSHRVAILRDGRILADGAPAEILTRPLMRSLYDVDVEPHRLADGRLVFMPPAVGGQPAPHSPFHPSESPA
ncbi:MAG: ABC transporter ATP-binding protein [Proteobacteria bacterium]|nr:ABC transporter ATP-binding protein [Pseudomonadota bacterium]